jgi:hypothetical protein
MQLDADGFRTKFFTAEEIIRRISTFSASQHGSHYYSAQGDREGETRENDCNILQFGIRRLVQHVEALHVL